jgi:signal peptidase I
VTSPTEESTGKQADAAAKSRRRSRNEWIILLVLTVAGTFLIRAYVMQSYRIPSGSMEHTLHGCMPNCNNDRILVDKLSYHLHGVGRGDVVVFKTSDQQWIQAVGGTEDVVKRVIGLPGDTVMCCDAQGRVVVNGKALNEKYVFVDGPDPKKEFGPVTVPKGDLWVMGDHRNDSSDSRYNGPITISSVIGRAFMRIWPIKRIGGL